MMPEDIKPRLNETGIADYLQVRKAPDGQVLNRMAYQYVWNAQYPCPGILNRQLCL